MIRDAMELMWRRCNMTLWAMYMALRTTHGSHEQFAPDCLVVADNGCQGNGFVLYMHKYKAYNIIDAHDIYNSYMVCFKVFAVVWNLKDLCNTSV